MFSRRCVRMRSLFFIAANVETLRLRFLCFCLRGVSLPDKLKRLENEYSLKEELDSTWAARPIAVTAHWDRTVLVLEDPGGVPLHQLLDLRAQRRVEGGEATARSRRHYVWQSAFRPRLVLCISVALFTRTLNRPMSW